MANKVFKMCYDDQSVIRQVAKPVEDPASPKMKKRLEEMVEYLKDSQDEAWAKAHGVRGGVGLAAPQIGIGERFFAVYVDIPGRGIVCYGLVNPVLLSTSVRRCALRGGEGCLSVAKDKEGFVPRYFRVRMKGYDVFQGKEIEISESGYPAIILQHEYDHLNGILYYDHIDRRDPWNDDPSVTKIA